MADAINSLPDVNIYAQDGGLGRTPAVGMGSIVMIGTSVIPTAEPLRIRSKKDIAKLGAGVLSEELADLVDVATPPQLWAYSISPDVFLDPQAKIEGSTDTEKLPAMEGESQTAWEATFLITTEGAPNVATFSWKFNQLEKSEQTVPLDKKFVIPNTGVTITFKDQYDAGDSFTIWTEGTPEVSDARMLESIEAVTKYRLDVEFIALSNLVSKVVLAALGTMLDKIAEGSEHYYLWALTCREGLRAHANDVDAYLKELEEDIKIYRNKRVAVIAMEARVVSQGEEKVKIPLGITAGFISTKKVGQGLNEVANSDLPNFLGIYPENLDESVQIDLMKLGYICYRTFHGKDGVYITDPRTTMEETSDYYRIERMRVVNKACKVERGALLPYVNSQLLVGSDGKLRNVGIIKATAEQAMMTMQRSGDISGFSIFIDEYQDVLANDTLSIELKIQPVGYMKWITVNISYENPNSSVAV